VIVAVDTKVCISPLQFAKNRGPPTLALEKAMSEDVIAACDEMDAEILRVLTEKFSWERHRATSALQTILARGVRVKIRGTVKVCRDPGDDMFLECAALAKADVLVAGDKDLLILGTYKGTRIITPAEYPRGGWRYPATDQK
jgi:putative PIN family toxin of toxin-antitoxin system